MTHVHINEQPLVSAWLLYGDLQVETFSQERRRKVYQMQEVTNFTHLGKLKISGIMRTLF